MAMLPAFLLVLFLQASAAEKPHKDNHRAFPTKNDVIAFSAELSTDVELAAGSPLMFNRTITNVGGLYFNTSGQFVCPEGLYVFIWNVASSDGMRCIGSLRKGGIDEKYGPKNSYNADYPNSGVSEMTAILECSSDPPTAVTINSQPWTGGSSNSKFRQPYTSFTGFKLQAGVAFTVELSQDQILFPGGRIMFDNVISNRGEHYDITSALFRCPDGGVYAFSVSTHTRDPSTPWSVSRLMMEREVVMQGPMTHSATENYDSGSASTTTVLHCVPDFAVYVEAQAAHDFPHNSYGAELTSFSGFKLYDIAPDAIAFTVVMSQNFTSAKSLDPIPFDEAITNIGSAFEISMNHSRFVCPDGAFYLFTWTAVVPYDRSFMDLQMDGSIVKQSIMDRTESSEEAGTSGSCSQTVILECQPASVLQVVSRNSNEHFIGGYTTFTGYKLLG